MRSAPSLLRASKNGLFEPFVYKNEHFTKTGSGQTYGKLKKGCGHRPLFIGSGGSGAIKTARFSLARVAVLSLSWQSIVRFSIETLNESDSENAVQTQDPSKAEEEQTSLEQLRYDAANRIITPPCCV